MSASTVERDVRHRRGKDSRLRALVKHSATLYRFHNVGHARLLVERPGSPYLRNVEMSLATHSTAYMVTATSLAALIVDCY